MIIKLAETNLKTTYGEWSETLFYDGKRETIAFFFGKITDGHNILCRLHSSCIHGHYFNSIECACQAELDQAMEQIQKESKGLIILMDHEGKGNGHMGLLKSIAFKRQGVAQAEAYQKAGYSADARDFSAAPKIIQHFKISSLRLMTANQTKVKAFEDKGISISLFPQ